jgi:hypothetical protein
MIFALADRHHWPVSLVEEMPETEFREWIIWLTKIKPEQDRRTR